MSYFVYILECKDGTLYTGITNDLRRRLHQHNFSKSGARYTKQRRPTKLVYSEKFKTHRQAARREKEIQSWPRAEKLRLISGKAL